MEYKKADCSEEIYRSNELIYRTLFKPLGLNNSDQEDLKITGEEHHFIAINSEGVVGSMVVVINNDYVELRHGAVQESYRNKGIGGEIWDVVCCFLREKDIKEIKLYSRNSALKFWKKLGFFETSDWLEHELFSRHGIRYKKMKYVF